MKKSLKYHIPFMTNIIGGIIGVIIGAIEALIGRQIKELIGYKEDPLTLGVITMILSIVVVISSTYGYFKKNPNKDTKLIIFLSQLIPTIICFSTVGLLWFIPGPIIIAGLIMITWLYLVDSSGTIFMEIEKKPFQLVGVKISRRTAFIISILGSITLIVWICLGFFYDVFSLLVLETSNEGIKHSYRTIPIDYIKHRTIKNRTIRIDYIEDNYVRIVYIILLIGAIFSFITTIFKSRLLILVGAIIILTGLFIFIAFLPFVFTNIHYDIKQGYILLSLGLGWYLSLLSGIEILFGGLFIDN